MPRGYDPAAAAACPAPPGAVPGELARAVAACRRNAAFLAEIGQILAEASADTDQADDCRACGQCCRFAEFGHRLYVSTGELALLTLSPPPAAVQPGRCPYQTGPACTARDRRALGCRLFVCQSGSAERSAAAYERFHARIRHCHADHALPYLYVELAAGLAELAGGFFCIDTAAGRA